jgi:hypothetical protein
MNVLNKIRIPKREFLVGHQKDYNYDQEWFEMYIERFFLFPLLDTRHTWYFLPKIHIELQSKLRFIQWHVGPVSIIGKLCRCVFVYKLSVLIWPRKIRFFIFHTVINFLICEQKQYRNYHWVIFCKQFSLLIVFIF